ncbi:hypothetical protein VdG1_03030 [Verticillium dahliae VDG1]|nr:hypothetical protein VdG1_03030 [Verticillium dahliae VDG1]
MYSNNFGVIEVAGAKTKSAPGWAYVPDTGVNPAAAALQPSNRKRARNQAANPSGADLSVRQEAKIRKEVEALDRESNRDASIPIPPKAGGAKCHLEQEHTQREEDTAIAKDVRKPPR